MNLHDVREEWRAALKRQMLAALREALLWIGKPGKDFDILFKDYKDPSSEDKVCASGREGHGHN